MKRSYFFLLTALLSATMAWAAVGDEFVSEGIRYSILNESEVELRRFEEYPIGSVTIPAFVSYEGKEYAVVYIGNLSCADCAALTTVNFAEGSQLLSVDSYAFAGCTNLTSITFPPTIIYLNHTAFLGCSNLVSINLEANNIHLMSADGVLFANGIDGVLFNSDKISITIYPEGRTATSYTIPKGVVSIFPYAFNCNTSLTSVTIPNSVDGISKYAFKGCSNLSDIYCYADPATLFWAADTSEFKPNKETLCHVKSFKLAEFNAQWNTGNLETDINVTFVGDLADGIETLTANSVKGNAVYNLSGQRIGGMAKGLNIVDGRKVWVK